MNKFVNFASEIRLSSLVCSSIAVLLTACGAAGEGDATSTTQAERNLATVSGAAPQSSGSASASASGRDNAGERPASIAAETGSASAAAPQLAVADAPASVAAPGPAEFVVAGYGVGPQEGASAPAPATAKANVLAADVVAVDAASAGVPASAAARTASTPYNYYVSPNGNDKDDGSASAPFATLARAAKATRAGTTIWVAPGTYAGGFKTTVNGTAQSRISFVSTTRHGARIVPPANSPNDTAWDNRGSYVDIVGFQVDGRGYNGGKRWTHGIYNGGSYDTIRYNHVHNIATNVPCTSAGGSAIGVDSYYHGEQSDVIANVVHDIGPAGCRFVQGIYISTSGTVKNNLVYRVAEAAIHLWHDANHVIIANNTVTTSDTGIIVGGGDYYHTSGPNDYTEVYNNIVFDNNYGISEQGKTGTHNVYRNNLVAQNPTYNWRLRNGLTHTGTVSSDPLFWNYRRSGMPDLRIADGSPAIGRGTDTEALNYDFIDRPRNSETGFDIGAYQH